jgi:pilus assembly protein Flp/PilA
MITLLKKLWKEESGQDLAEYGIALLVIAVGAAAFAVTIGTNVNALWQAANTAIQTAVDAL